MWTSKSLTHCRVPIQLEPIFGTKDVLFRRLCGYEQIAAKLAVATELVTQRSPWSSSPSEVERQHHMVNHLSPAPWCELCVMGRGKDDPHLRSCARRENSSL